MFLRRNSSLLPGMLVIAIVCACSSNDGPELAAVRGLVTFNGKPLENASVIFIPEAGPGSDGITDENGEFTLHNRWKEGACVGPVRVAITAHKLVNTDKEFSELTEREIQKHYVSAIPTKYGRPDTSGLTATVESHQENYFTFELTDER